MEHRTLRTPAAYAANLGDAEQTSSLSLEVARLRSLPLADLKAEWHRTFPDRQIPARLSRDLLVRTIAWKLQEEAFGRFPPASARKLQRLSQQLRKSGSLDVERETIVKPGTTLLREWKGETHRVSSVEDGFIFREQRFASLSEVARVITGTQWSGPRFFGLKQRSNKAMAGGSIDN